jgi:CheY-like chemotaxis protein
MGKHVLVLENDANDALLIGMAFKSLVPPVSWYICRNPGEAKAYLRGVGLYSNREKYPLPAAIFTDIKMDGQTGIQFLAWIRGQSAFKHTPIVVLTGAGSPEEIRQAEELGAQRVLAKPARLQDLQQMLQQTCTELFAEAD